MTVQLTSRTFDELSNTIQELELLTSRPGNLTSKESARNSFLLAKMAMLRQGVDVSELRNFERDKILAEIGHKLPAQCRTKLSEDVEAEWRNFLRGGEIRKTSRPSESELRYTGQLAGQQTILYPKDVTGGAFCPQDFAPRSFDVMAAYDETMNDWASTIIDTPTGATFTVPLIDNTVNGATILGESVKGSEVTVANFSQSTLGAFKFASGILALSIELDEDSAFPWGAVLEKLFATRMARGVSRMLLTGNGTNQPTGLRTAIIASGTSPIIASGSSVNDGSAQTGANSLGVDDFVKCLHSPDAAYRRNAIWAMSDDTLLAAESLNDKYGHPLVSFRRGLTDAGGEFPTILGRRVAVCPSMSDIGASTNSVLLYAPEYYVIRRVPASLYLQSFREAVGLAEAGLTGLMIYGRCDGTLVSTQNASKVPASYLQCHS